MTRFPLRDNNSAVIGVEDDLSALPPESETARRFTPGRMRTPESRRRGSVPYRAGGTAEPYLSEAPSQGVFASAPYRPKFGAPPRTCRTAPSRCRTLTCPDHGPERELARSKALALIAADGGPLLKLGVPVRPDATAEQVYSAITRLRERLPAVWIAYAREPYDGNNPGTHVHALVSLYRDYTRRVSPDWTTTLGMDLSFDLRSTARGPMYRLPPKSEDDLDALSTAILTAWPLRPESNVDTSDPAIARRLVWVDTVPGIRKFDLDGRPRNFRGQSRIDGAFHVITYMSKRWLSPRTRTDHMALQGGRALSVRLCGIDQNTVDVIAGLR